MKRLWIATGLMALFLSGCGNGDSVTGSGGGQTGEDVAVEVTLNIGEHRDIELAAEPETLYSVSSRALASVGSYNSTLSCTPSMSVGEVAPAASTNVSFGILNAAPAVRPVLRLIGVYAGQEVVCAEVVDSSSGKSSWMRIKVIVNPASGGDIIGGDPIDPLDPPDGNDDDDGNNNGGPPDPSDPGDKPIYDADACVTTGFYYVDDDYNDVEGKFGPDTAAYMRSTMPGSTVDSQIRLYYPVTTKPTTLTYTDLGQYAFKTKDNVTVSFDLQMAHHLFGLAKKYFYVSSNGYCMRGQIPTSVMTAPNKTLTWVSSNYSETQ